MVSRGVVLVLLAFAAAGCGSSGGGPTTLRDLLERKGQDVAVIPGTSDHAAGRIRYSFLVVRGSGELVSRPTARVWVAPGLDEEPVATATARLEPVGVENPSRAPAPDAKELYVVHVDVPRPGKYFLLAEPVGAKPAVQALADLEVRERTKAPAIGTKAHPSKTPTIRSTGGDFSKLTTRDPPDVRLLRYSVAESLAARKPFVLVFATPKFCTSRTCGPVVDVVEAVSRRFAGDRVRFIHVEVHVDHDPAKGVNRWMKEWNVPTEPFTFLVARDGRIRGKFEGSFSIRELETAVRKRLLGER